MKYDAYIKYISLILSGVFICNTPIYISATAEKKKASNLGVTPPSQDTSPSKVSQAPSSKDSIRPKAQAHQADFELEAVEILLTHDHYKTVKQLPFEDVMMELNSTTPYVSLKSIFDNLLGYDMSCDGPICNVVSIPPDYVIQIDADKHQVDIETQKDGKESKTTKKFQADDLFYKNEQVWIKYDLIKDLIPMTAKWDISNYKLFYQTNLPLYYIIKQQRDAQRKKLLRQQKERKYKEEMEKRIQPIKPGQKFGANFKYRLTHKEAFNPNHEMSNTGTYSALTDLFGGTLRSDGSVDFDHIGQTDPSWSYTFMHKKYFHLLKFGDVNMESSLFMGNQNLVNGIQFDLNKSSDTSLSFRYEDIAIPGTDIELWRGGFLVETVTVDESGRYVLFDPNSEPGDMYRIKFYYPDGSEETKQVKFSPDKNLLLAKGKWDINASYGTPSSSTLGIGTMASYLLRYGLLKTITLGLGRYDFNGLESKSHQGMNYADIAWQIRPYWNINAQHMLGNADVAAQSSFTYFKKHFITAEYQQINENSDILELPTVSGDYAATKRLVLEDKYTLNNGWRLVGTYDDTNQDRDIEAGLQARASSLYSINAQLGHYYNYEDNKGAVSVKLDNTFQFNKNHQLKANFFWNADSKDTETLSYQYRNNYKQHYSFTFSANVTHTGLDGKIAPSASLSWNMGHHWAMSGSAGLETFTLQLSYQGAWSSYNGFVDPGDFSSGTLRGRIITPDTSEPVANIKVSAGGKSTETDAKGFYTLTGLPTYTKLPLKVEPEKAGLPFINSRKTQFVWFRPHTQIDHNFRLSELVGLDGFVVSNDALPENTVVRATSIKTGDYWDAPVAKEDGFYAFEGLPEGTYQLTVQGMKEPPLPKVVTITAEEQWLSDVELFTPDYKE